MPENNIDGLADVKVEGQDAFGEQEEKTSTESLTVKEQEEVKPDQGKSTDNIDNTPFHKHPRWIERENELKTLRERDEARAKEIAELRQKQQEISEKNINRDIKIPEWFSVLYGDNAEAWSKYSEYSKQEREEIKREILETQQKAQIEAQEQEKYWDNWVENELAKLEDKGYKFDRKELIQIMHKTRPTDMNGNLDFEAGYETYVARKGPSVVGEQSQARKKIADVISNTSKKEPAKKDFLTSNDLRNKSWHQLAD